MQWWNTLHQGASIRAGGATIETTMLAGMLLMTLAFWSYAIAVILVRVRAIIVDRERSAAWIATQLPAGATS